MQATAEHLEAPAPTPIPHATADQPLGPPRRFIDLEHSRVPYWRIGSGPDLVFVHGWPLHAATFRGLVQRWSRQFTCHLFDLPGAGRSEWDGQSQIGMEPHCQTTRRVIGELALDQYALVAHDSGAVYARYAAQGDGRVRGLVMGNTEIPGHRPAMVKLYIAASRVPGAAAAFSQVLRVRWLRRSALGFGGCFDDLSLLDGEFHELFVRPLIEDRRALAGQMRLVEGFDWGLLDALADVHAQIAAPALLIWGADDPFFPLSKAPSMLPQFAGGAELVTLRPGKLFVHDERPDAFAAHATPFLQRCFESPVSA